MGLDIFCKLILEPREKEAGENDADYIIDINNENDKKTGAKLKADILAFKEELKENPELPVPAQIKERIGWLCNMMLKDDKVKALDRCLKEIDSDWYTPQEDAYFRKVNAVYAYFADRLDREMCIITKYDVEDLLEKANKVYEEMDDDFSRETLPTTGGFFFGSTDYEDDYYEYQVTQIIDKMTKLKAKMEKLEEEGTDYVCYIRMSW